MTKIIKNFLNFKSISNTDIESILLNSELFKSSKRPSNDFQGKTLALLFSKKSTRTRLSAETGWNLMGGSTLFLGINDLQLSSGEPLSVTARVISSMADCIIARLGSHSDILEIAKYSSVPVINALTDKHHPLQILADLCTIRELYNNPSQVTIAWVGDNNNILNSMLEVYSRFDQSNIDWGIILE